MPVPVDAQQAAACMPRRHGLHPLVPAVALLIAGLVVGFGAARLIDDPHTARTESITGTVTWSNAQTRLIAFEADGAERDPNAGDTVYSVIGDWQDVDGTFHGGGDYPRCLAGGQDNPVSMGRHRVRLEVLYRDTGTAGHPQNIAVQVHCLD